MGEVVGARWNGRPVVARRGTVVIGKSLRRSWWCADMEGERIEALRIEYPGVEPFFIADDDGQGTEKVLRGGGPWSGRGHRSIPVDDPLSWVEYEEAGDEGR